MVLMNGENKKNHHDRDGFLVRRHSDSAFRRQAMSSARWRIRM